MLPHSTLRELAERDGVPVPDVDHSASSRFEKFAGVYFAACDAWLTP